MAASMLALACGDDDGGSAPDVGDAGVGSDVVGAMVGAVGAPCYPNDTCNAGLSCVRKVCVKENGTSMDLDGGAGGTGAPASDLDAGSDSGVSIDPCEADSEGCSSQVKRVFTTKEVYPSDLQSAGKGDTGLEGADNICNETADEAGLGGKWKAWLSDSSTNAIDRIADVGPWYLVDGVTKVFEDKENLMGSPIVPLDQDENGVELVAPRANDFDQSSLHVWTGTQWGGATSDDSDGGTSMEGNCMDWLGVAASATGESGHAGSWMSNRASWTDEIELSCVGMPPFYPTNRLHLYCIEQ